jgi:hypothetical protein
MADERVLNRQAAPAARRAVASARATVAPVAVRALPASHSLQQRLGNQGTHALATQLVARSPEPKSGPGCCAGCGQLTVSKPGDTMEIEADRVADAVMRMPASGNAAAGVSSGGGTYVVHRHSDGAATPDTSPPVESNVRTLQSEGSPLPPATREFFESRMGADFSKVRVNTGARATQTAQSLGARAFTVGSSITFGEGQYAPESQEGKKLLAHELTHVVQQDGGSRGTQTAHRAASVPPISRAAAPQLQAAWYNFDIPFTDYQFDPSLEGVKTAAGVVKDAAVDAFNWIVDQIRDAVNSGIAWLKEQALAIQDLINSAGAALKSAFANILSFLLSPFGFLINAFVNLDTDAISRGWAAFSGLVARIANGFKKTIDMFFAPIEKLWRKIDSFATGVLNRVEGLLNHWAFRKLPDILQDAAHTLVNALKLVWRTISDTVLPLIQRMRKWVEGALDVVFGFVRRVLNFGINVIINGINTFGKVVLFLRDFFNAPGKYIAILAEKTLPTFSGMESRFAAKVSEFFGGGQSSATTAAPPVQVQRAPDPAADKSSASWGDIGNGVLEVMGRKWQEFKSNPLAIVKQLLMDLFLPVVGNVTDVIQLFKDIRDIVTAPLSASSLDEFWTSLLKLLDIPILIYKTVTSILMRSLALPLLVASFIPHPVVKGVAAAIGYALLSMFIESELLDIGHKVLLLKTGKLNKAEKEKAYNRVGDSIIGLIMTGVIIVVMLILHFIASVVKGIYNFVKAKVFNIEAKPVEVKGGQGGNEGKGKGGPEENKGANGKGPKEGTLSEDGKRKIKINEEGKCEVCASPCDEVRKKYAAVMTPEFEARIKVIEDDVKLTDPEKEVKLKPIEQDLADLQARASGKLIGDMSSLTDAEAKFVREQLAAGKKVEILPPEAGRTPDFKIDGQRVELKTISGVADTTSDGISKAIANRVMNGRGQATDIIVDARGQAGITQEIAERGIGRAYGADNKTGGKITSIRVIGPGFDITIPRK